METLLKNKVNFLIVLLAFTIGVGLFVVLKDFEKTTVIIIAICGAVLTLGLLFFNLKWYYYLLIALIPISIDAWVYRWS